MKKLRRHTFQMVSSFLYVIRCYVAPSPVFLKMYKQNTDKNIFELRKNKVWMWFYKMEEMNLANFIWWTDKKSLVIVFIFSSKCTKNIFKRYPFYARYHLHSIWKHNGILLCISFNSYTNLVTCKKFFFS